MRRLTAIALSIAASFLCTATSCVEKGIEEVSLEQTPLISEGLGWGVVSLAYARLMLEPSTGAADSGTARRGDAGRILARSRVFEGRDAGDWYRVEVESATGWLHESSVSVYRSEAEARNAVEAGL